METMLYPASFSPVAEEEMTYISGGAGDDAVGTIAAIGVALSMVGVCYAIMGINDKRLREEYTSLTGLSPVDEKGRLTTDFENYKERSRAQGRDQLTGLSINLINYVVPAVFIGGVAVFALAAAGSQQKA